MNSKLEEMTVVFTKYFVKNIIMEVIHLVTLSICNCMFFNPSVADDPSGATGCTTHGINPKLVILLVFVQNL